MKLPARVLVLAPPRIDTPTELPEMTFAEKRFSWAVFVRTTPGALTELVKSPDPVDFTPMKLFWTELVLALSKYRPPRRLAEITFREAAVGPPMVFPVTPVSS